MKRMLAAAAIIALGASAALAEDEVTLESGEVLKGRIVEKSAMEVTLEHPVLGKLVIPGSRVKSVLTEADKLALKNKAEEPAWKSRFELGVTGSLGNTRNQNVLAGLVSDYTRPKHLWHFEFRYFAKEVEGEATESRFYGIVRKDWILADPRYTVFAEARYDRDLFQAWHQRATVSAGVTRKFIDRKDFFLAGRIGAAATKEWGVEGPDREKHVRPEGLLGLETKWQIDATKLFTAQATYYPDLSDTPEYRLLATAGLKYRMDDKGALNLGVGAEYEFDTHRVEPFKRADVRYFALLSWDF